MSKFALSIVFCLFTIQGINAEEPSDQPLRRAKALAKETKKPVLIKFTSVTCGACTKMKASTLVADKVKSKLENFVVIEIDIDSHTKIAEDYRVEKLPTFLVLTPNAVVVDRASEFIKEERFLQYLASFQTMSADIEKASSAVREAAKTGETDKQMLWGKYLAKRGNHSDAIDVFMTIYSDEKKTNMQRQTAATQAVNSQLLIKRFDHCRKLAESAIALDPESKQAALAQYLVAYSFEMTSEQEKAKLRYQKLVKEFPGSRFGKLAQARLKALN